MEQQGPDCDPRRMWLQIPFFCGTSASCWEPGSDWALAEAKHNLVTRYLVVGVTEQLEQFMEVGCSFVLLASALILVEFVALL